MKRLACAAILLVAAAPGGSDGDPAGYRIRLPISPVAGATVQRIVLPAQVLAAAQDPEIADLRVFDARGRAMPIARAPTPPSAMRSETFAALPILGPADGLKVTGMSLRLDDSGRARLAEFDGTPLDSGGAPVLLGALFDTRAVGGTTRRIVLDADLPTAQPVTFTIAASRDLKTWRTFGEQVVYRRQDETGGPTIALADADLRRDYLRVTWSAGARLLSPVAVRGATLAMQPSGETTTVTIAATLPSLADARTIDIAIPFATPIDALRIVPGGDDLIVPVRILGRNDREQPWSVLGRGTARRDAPADIALSGVQVTMLRIAANPRTPGFTAPPTLRLGFAPRAIAFVAAGTPPFTLAAGHAGGAEVYLPLASLTDARTASLPEATVTGTAAPLRLALADPGGGDRRRMLLWAVLLAATAALGGVAWLLWRRTSAIPQP